MAKKKTPTTSPMTCAMLSLAFAVAELEFSFTRVGFDGNKVGEVGIDDGEFEGMRDGQKG